MSTNFIALVIIIFRNVIIYVKLNCCEIQTFSYMVSSEVYFIVIIIIFMRTFETQRPKWINEKNLLALKLPQTIFIITNSYIRSKIN